MNKHVLVGTFHKTGTVWMQTVFERLAKKIDCEFINVSRYHSSFIGMDGTRKLLEDLVDSKERKIIFDGHSKFGDVPWLPEAEFSGFKVVRNPVDAISSAAKYHSWSDEEWLHRVNEKFSGLTYHEAINHLPTENERYRFEMDNSAMWQVRFMSMPLLTDICRTVKYEELFKDKEMTLFSKLLLDLGFDASEIKKGKKVFWANSLFGGMKARENGHIQNRNNFVYGSDWDDVTWGMYDEKVEPMAIKLGYGRSSL